MIVFCGDDGGEGLGGRTLDQIFLTLVRRLDSHRIVECCWSVQRELGILTQDVVCILDQGSLYTTYRKKHFAKQTISKILWITLYKKVLFVKKNCETRSLHFKYFKSWGDFIFRNKKLYFSRNCVLRLFTIFKWLYNINFIACLIWEHYFVLLHFSCNATSSKNLIMTFTW